MKHDRKKIRFMEEAYLFLFLFHFNLPQPSLSDRFFIPFSLKFIYSTYYNMPKGCLT